MAAESESRLPVLLRTPLQRALRLATSLLIGILLLGSWWCGDWTSPEPQRPAADAALAIDVNRATLQELMLMPGVGEITARRILRDRQTHGPFQSLDDLKRIAGIGPKTVAKLKPYCRAGAADGEYLIAER